MPSNAELPLSGVRVIDVSDRLAGTYCTKLLVDAGAEVIKVEPPSGDPLRHRRSGTSRPGSPESGVLFRYLCASKQSVVLDLETAQGVQDLHRLLASADLVVETSLPDVAARRGLTLTELRKTNPRITLVSISAFGRGGPRSGEDMPEFLLQALSGAIYSRGRPGRDPLHVAGEPAEWMAGAVAAGAAAGAVFGTAHSDVGEHVDVSILESAALSLVTAPVIAASMRGRPHRVSALRSVPGIERCADGWVGLFMLTAQQWFDFTVMIERPELADNTALVSLNERAGHADELVPLIEKWTTTRTVDEVLEMAELLRIPAAPIGNGETVPNFEAIARRGVYVRNPDGFRQPRSMFRFDAIPDRPIETAPSLGQHTELVLAAAAASEEAAAAADRRVPRAAQPIATTPPTPGRPLEGVRIVDLTAFWSGPFATGILSALGAEVIKIESVQRPDALRFTGFWPATQDRWYEAAPLFNALNLDKRSLTLDLSCAEGRDVLMRLVARADIVVENFTPRVLDNFGLGYEQFAAVRPDVILARMPAFGLDGPWRDRPGFAPTVEQMTGLAWINGYEDTEPIAPNGIVDPLAGAHLAFGIIAALRSRQRTGRGMQLELPMVEVATTMTAEQVIEFELSGQLLMRHANGSPSASPQGVYVCTGTGSENWVAISVSTDDQWSALSKVLRAEEWEDPLVAELASGEGRWQHHEAIDVHLREWCAVRSVDEIMSILGHAGVPAAPVVGDHQIVSDVQMQARGFWQQVDHPVIGEQWYAGFPIHREGPWYRRSSPLLGQDNDVILTELGLSAEEIRGLEQRNVIGHVPAGL